MSKQEPPTSLENLEARLLHAKKRHEEQKPREGGAAAPMSGFGLAFRYGIEMVSAVIVGTGIGLLIDNWLEIAPWGMIVFFFLGAAAGMLNLYRAVAGFGLAPGYKAPHGEEAQDDEVRNGGKGNDPDAGEKK